MSWHDMHSLWSGDFRAVPALCRPCAALCDTLVWEPLVSGLGSLVWEAWEAPSARLSRWSPRPPVLTCGPRGCS